jgi:iron complex outermembrane recepter protein
MVSQAQVPGGAAGAGAVAGDRGGAAPRAVAASAVAGGQDGSALQDIVVTAQRRSERLQSVPIAVSAVSSAQLAKVGISSTQDLAIVTPGLTVPQTAGFTQPHLRGIGASTAAPGSEQPVATYVDGVFMAFAPSTLLTLNNIERVEVLKGPQGTLFGRNATGGLIQVITRDPTSTPHASVSVGYANYRDVTADAYVTGGLSDGAATDLAVHYEAQGQGWGRNLVTGHDVNRLDHDFAIRNKWLLRPTDTTEVRIAGDYSDRAGNQNAQKPLPSTAAFNIPAFGGPFNYGGTYDTADSFDPYFRLKGGGVSLQVNQDVGRLKLLSISAYRDAQFRFGLDVDRVPADLFRTTNVAHSRQFSQELQLSPATNGRLKWVAGAYYFHARDWYAPNSASFTPTIVSPIPFTPVAIDTYGTQVTNSLAGYAQVTYAVLDRLNVTGGVRYTWEKRSISGAQIFSIAGFPAATTPFPPTGAGAYPPSITARKATYRISIDYKVTPDILAYASYNTGFKSGGYNVAVPTNPPYLPEELDAAEVGIKSELFSHRLRLNVAAFDYTYKNIQVARFVGASQIFYNGAKAKLYGVDIDAELALGHGIRLTGGYSYVHNKFTSFPTANYVVPVNGCTPSLNVLCTASATGNHLPYAPTSTFNLGADYRLSLGSAGSLSANVNYYRSSKFYGAPDNVFAQSAYDLVNASLTWENTPRTLSAKLWAKNIGKTVYAVSILEAGNGTAKAYGAPQTYGVTLGYKF